MKIPVAAWFRENRSFLLFLVGFLFFRTAIADWNPVPSGSMRPTIDVGAGRVTVAEPAPVAGEAEP